MKKIQTTGRNAISYVRFSTKEQLHGFSLVRQLEGTKDFCRRHNLFLDESLTIKDLGKSAFKGKNADSGNLAVFLEAVREKRIPKGTVLVVEALDRLTRNNIVEASHLLTDILRNGIDVGMVTEDKVYSYDYINKNPFEFIVATTYLIRGGNESQVKSDRVKDAWVRKKQIIAEKKMAVKIPTPCWLKREGSEWVLIKRHVRVVRKIFADYLADGLGIWKLSQSLNARRVPTIAQRGKPGSKWHRITIHRMLTDKATIGTYTKTEPPVENYFPAIISEDDFYAVQAKLKNRRQFRGRHSLKDVSLFKGLCKCGKCGATMTRVTRTRKTAAGDLYLHRYLYCHNSILGVCKPARSVNLTLLEDAFMKYTKSSRSAGLWFVEHRVDEKVKSELARMDGQIADKIVRRERLLTAIEEGTDTAPDSLVVRIKSLEAEIKDLETQKEAKQKDLNRPADWKTQNEMMVNAEEAYNNYRRQVTRVQDTESPRDRLKLRELVRQFVIKMVLYPEEKRAVFNTIAGNTREIRW